MDTIAKSKVLLRKYRQHANCPEAKNLCPIFKEKKTSYRLNEIFPPASLNSIGYETATEKLHQGKNKCLKITVFPNQSGSSIGERRNFPRS